MDVILLSFPVTIGQPKGEKPPCLAEAWPKDGNPALRVSGSTPKLALRGLIPKIISERDMLEEGSLRWEKLELAREKAEQMLENPEKFSIW